MSAKAQKPQEYFVYFKVFATQAGAKFAAGRAWGFIQRFPKAPHPSAPEDADTFPRREKA
ncbi:MAG: hypothetical protein IJU29_05210 [Oscillospiraceae bacterium]|nr:hypothetical protein [Oscillospiraceae bacterium]